jgi:hypothetical protein
VAPEKEADWHQENRSHQPIKPIKAIKPIEPIRPIKPIAPMGKEYYWVPDKKK